MVGRRYAEFVRSIDFEFVRPRMRRGQDGRFTLARRDGTPATLLELHKAPLDALNTRLEERHEERTALYRLLRPLFDVPRMGTFATGALINRAVERMRPEEAYVNVGVWNGFSLLCGLQGHPDKRCVGIDNFSQWSDRSQSFLAHFEARKGPAHRFFRMDYQDYFAHEHEGPIGLYFYDGDHEYEHQLRGLEIAEPFFSEDCVVVVDDTNWGRARQATYDFFAKSDRQYEVLLDVQTAQNEHPTYWNGLMVFQATGDPRSEPPAPSQADRSFEPPGPEAALVDFEGRSTLVTVAICEVDEGGTELEAAIEAALQQTWEAIQVLVVDSSTGGSVRETVARFGDRVSHIQAQAGESPARTAFEAARGAFVAPIDAATRLDENAVEAGLALPRLSGFSRGSVDGIRERLRRALAAGRGISETIPRDESFVIAAVDFTIPQGVDRNRAVPFFDQPGKRLGEEEAIARLEELKSQGAGYAAFFWGLFGWLDSHPLLAEHLRATSKPVLENEDVRIVEFR